MNKPLFENADCISLYVDNLDDGIAFYAKALGLNLLWRAEESCGLGMENDITEVVLCLNRNPMVDFKVECVEEALKVFTEAGGMCEVGPFDIAIGKCAVVSDRWENHYCILDMSKGTYDTDEYGNTVGVSKK